MKVKRFGSLEIRVFSNLETLSQYAGQIFLNESEKFIKSKGFFTCSLSGGSTPQKLFELLAADFRDKINWQKIHIFWGDERAGKNNPESNFQIAFRLWLKYILKENPIFKSNIHRIKMELGLIKGAKEYSKELRKWAPQGFDLALNGVGADGHRNGIMPENSNLNWKNKIWDLPEKVKVYGYEAPREISSYSKRITLTPWFLNKSKTNILILSGKDKSDLLKKITRDKEKYTKRDLPAITFNDVPIIVLTDAKAASKI